MRRATLVFAALASIATSATALAPAPASATVTTVTTGADAYVDSSRPGTNFGTTNPLRVRNQTKIAYVRFTVPAPATGEQISKVTLQLYANSASGCRVEVLTAASSTWGESTITWNNRPGVSASAIASASWSAAGYQSFDVSGAVTTSGRMTFVLRHDADCAATVAATLRSREALTNKPRLRVETSAVASACRDGDDNDGDGLIDYPSDPGCTGTDDPDEADGPTMPPGPVRTVAAAGDIVCDPGSSAYAGGNPAQCQHRATDDLLSGADAVLELGDLQYSNGTLSKFDNAYDPTWGQYAATSYPSVGNHEYTDPAGGAAGYFTYWSSKNRPTGGNGYYSFDLGSWHLISLNSNCSKVACDEGLAQNDWLENDLASTAQPCILAYWHHPRFNSGVAHGADVPAGAFWTDLFAARADLVLNGHEHNYQRYGKQDGAGVARGDGIREFVVGTGGNSHYGMLAAKDSNFEFGNTTDFGVLRLYLGAGAYSWAFVNTAGATVDSGGPVPCN